VKSGNSYNNNLRRWFHFLSIAGISLAYGFSTLTWTSVAGPLSIAAVVFILSDLLRLHLGFLNEFVKNNFSFILRKHEHHQLSGSSWFLIAAIMSLSLFTKPIAILGFLYLAIGDPLASYVGIKWGQREPGLKTWTGSLAFFIPCWIVGGFWLYHMAAVGIKMSIIIACNTAMVAALTERVVSQMDDNLAIPLATSCLATLMLL